MIDDIMVMCSIEQDVNQLANNSDSLRGNAYSLRNGGFINVM